ncbi:MAG TPA: GNAT family N-acetyltransferase [Balneolaceae bacterium]
MEVIETERLVLRQQIAEDAPFILKLVNDPDWIKHIGDRGVRTIAQARAYINDGAVAMYDQHGFGLYLVETKPDRKPVGVCGLIQRDFLPDVDLGFALAPEHRSKGYAREAATATIAYGKDVIGLDRITAIVSPGNSASIRLLKELDFTFDRTFDYPDSDKIHLFALDL